MITLAYLKKKIEISETGCWIWKGGKNEHGYGLVNDHGKMIKAHRLAYALAKQPIPKGMLCCHACDNPPCINPDHLFLGTYRDNVIDMVRKNRQGIRRMPRPENRGSKNGNSTFTKEQVETIRARRMSGDGLQEIADDFGCSISTVSRVVHFQTHWETDPSRRRPLKKEIAQPEVEI